MPEEDLYIYLSSFMLSSWHLWIEQNLANVPLLASYRSDPSSVSGEVM
jgi:hypothetical protein